MKNSICGWFIVHLRRELGDAFGSAALKVLLAVMWLADHGRAITHRSIMVKVGWSSPSHVKDCLAVLESRGLITRTAHPGGGMVRQLGSSGTIRPASRFREAALLQAQAAHRPPDLGLGHAPAE